MNRRYEKLHILILSGFVCHLHHRISLWKYPVIFCFVFSYFFLILVVFDFAKLISIIDYCFISSNITYCCAFLHVCLRVRIWQDRMLLLVTGAENTWESECVCVPNETKMKQNENWGKWIRNDNTLCITSN